MSNDLLETLELCYEKAPEDAVEYLQSQDIEVSWDWKEQLEIVKKHSFTVAKCSSADVLQHFHDQLDKAMQEGQTFRQFKENMTDILDKSGFAKRSDGKAWRLDTVYRTNMQSAYMAGRYNQMSADTVTFPYWQYLAVLDKRTRGSHAQLHGMVFRADDAGWGTNYPPNGYRCRCRARPVNDDFITKKNLDVKKWDDQDYEPDEGFATNPAVPWQPDTSRYAAGIKKSLDDALERIADVYSLSGLRAGIGQSCSVLD